MRLEQLYYLIEVSNCRSLSEASERLHISQQALNVNIKTLEKELGLVLLNRTNRGITLTKAGIVLTQKANDVLSDLFKTIYTLQHNTPLPLEDNIEIAVEYTLLSHSALTKNLVRLPKSLRQRLSSYPYHRKKHDRDHGRSLSERNRYWYPLS